MDDWGCHQRDYLGLLKNWFGGKIRTQPENVAKNHLLKSEKITI